MVFLVGREELWDFFSIFLNGSLRAHERGVCVDFVEIFEGVSVSSGVPQGGWRGGEISGRAYPKP